MSGESPIRGDVAALDEAVQALRGGDSAGFVVLHEEFGDLLSVLARQRVGADADDAVQEVWCRVLECAGTLRLDGETPAHRVHQFRRYLLRTLDDRTGVMNYRRSQEDGAVEQLSQVIDAAAPDPSEGVLLRMIVPERYGDLIEDTHGDDRLTPSEIARRDGRSPEAVRAQLARAHKAVRNAYLA